MPVITHPLLTELSLGILFFWFDSSRNQRKCKKKTLLGSEVSSHMLPLCNSTGFPGVGENGEGFNMLQQGAGDD